MCPVCVTSLLRKTVLLSFVLLWTTAVGRGVWREVGTGLTFQSGYVAPYTIGNSTEIVPGATPVSYDTIITDLRAALAACETRAELARIVVNDLFLLGDAAVDVAGYIFRNNLPMYDHAIMDAAIMESRFCRDVGRELAKYGLRIGSVMSQDHIVWSDSTDFMAVNQVDPVGIPALLPGVAFMVLLEPVMKLPTENDDDCITMSLPFGEMFDIVEYRVMTVEPDDNLAVRVSRNGNNVVMTLTGDSSASWTKDLKLILAKVFSENRNLYLRKIVIENFNVLCEDARCITAEYNRKYGSGQCGAEMQFARSRELEEIVYESVVVDQLAELVAPYGVRPESVNVGMGRPFLLMDDWEDGIDCMVEVTLVKEMRSKLY